MALKPRQAKISLRPMTLADLEEVAAIDCASFPTPWPEEAFLYELKYRRNNLCWVAVLCEPSGDSLIVGSIVIWIAGTDAHIGTLAIRPGYRRRGIGQYLLTNALLKCCQKGVQQATLEVRESNRGAQSLYQKLGFEVTGTKQEYYQDTCEDAVVMTLSPVNSEKLADLANYG